MRTLCRAPLPHVDAMLKFIFKQTTCNYHTYICPWGNFAQCSIIRIEKMTTFLLLANVAVGDSKQHIYNTFCTNV